MSYVNRIFSWDFDKLREFFNTYVKGAIFSAIKTDGSAYDVSEHFPTGGPNSDGKFTLEYILNNANTLIPTSWRKGGMSIRFVQSADDKYMQYRLMATDWSTVVSDWQGVDSELISGSKNLIEGGVVAYAIGKLDYLHPLTITTGYGIIASSGVRNSSSDRAYTDYIDITGFTSIVYAKTVQTGNNAYGLAFYDSEKQFISGQRGISDSSTVGYTIGKVDIPEGAVYARFTLWKPSLISRGTFFYYDPTKDANERRIERIENDTFNSAFSTPFDSLITYPGCIASTGVAGQQVYRNEGGYTCKVIPVSSGQKIRIKIGSGSNVFWGLVKSYPIPMPDGDSTPDYATGESARLLPSTETEYTVPTDAKYAVIPVLVNGSDRQPSVLKIDGYDVFKGVVKSLLEGTTFSSGQKVSSTAIVNDLTTGGANKLLSAAQGKVLEDKKKDNDHVIVTKQLVNGSSNEQILFEATRDFGKDAIVELLSWTIAATSDAIIKVNYNIGETSQTFLGLSNIASRVDLHSDTDNITYIKISFQRNISQAATATVSLKYGDVYASGRTDAELNGETLIETTKTSSTSATVNIFNNSKIFIRKGTRVVFEMDEVGTVVSAFRFYINQTTTATVVSQAKYIYTAANDCTLQRVATIKTETLLDGQSLTLKVYTLGLEDDVADLQEDVADLQEQVGIIHHATKADLIKAAGTKYDAVTDSFSGGNFYIEFANNDLNQTKDLICRMTAKYTTDDDTVYPYIRVWFRNPPLNSSEERMIYRVGDNGKYRYSECKCITNIKTTGFSQTAYSGNYRVQISIPEGVTLYIKSFIAEYTNDIGDKDVFKIMQHGSIFNSDFNCETNWMGWSHVNNYGAVVVPKRTTDGVWVCYHDDSFGNSPNVQVIGDPTASLPAASVQACTYAQVQTLEYKDVNSFDEHDKIPTLELFFQYCVKMGVHPVFSMHPANWTAEQYTELRALAEKNNLLDKLNIKGGYDNSTNGFIQKVFNTFGSDIESFIIDKNDVSQADIEALAAYNWDMSRVKVGFEISSVNGSYYSDEILALMRTNGLVHGAYIPFSSTYTRSAEVIRNLISKGMYELTADYFYSNGLNW